MPYAFVPKEKYAKASGSNMRISTKSAAKLCCAIKNKTLERARRLLTDLSLEKRSLRGKYYTKTAEEILGMVESCEKNAEFLGLDKGKLFVHASARQGTMLKRRRRKAAFGSRMKTTNLEVMLIERGRLKGKADVIHVAGKKDAEKAVRKIAEKMKEKSEQAKEAAQ